MSATSMPRRRRSVSSFGLLSSFVGLITLIVISSLAFPVDVSAGQLTADEEAAWIESLREDIAERGLSFEVGPNPLTSIPWEEFREQYLGLRLPEGLEPVEIIDDHGVNDRDLPSHYDWREHHPIWGVRHQGACGSCWCFSAAGALEAAIIAAEGFEVDISEQHGMSCNTGGSGCSGGWMEDAYEVWQDYGAIHELDMPYQADDGIACPGSTYPAIARISFVTDVSNSVSAIKNAIYYNGPVSVTMYVYSDFQAYESGCYYNSCPSSLNHAVVLVGWDDSYCDGQGAWILRNSWGEEWGIEGYAYIRYDAACVGGYGSYVEYMPTAPLLGINHIPLENTEDTTSPYEIVAEIISTSGTVDMANTHLAYRVDRGPWVEMSMVPTGGANEFQAYIPAQPEGRKVEYYIHAEDTVGKVCNVPMYAPDEAYMFLVGTFELIHFDDFETEPVGWTFGDADDDATTGLWEWADPEETMRDDRVVQPENDHTDAPGRYCFVTDGRAGSSAGTYDVDGGKTTLLSPVFDLTGYELVVVDYYRWYTNRRGSNPYEDMWEVSVRAGGSDWYPMEYVSSCREAWGHRIHVLDDFVEPGADIQLRFVASDEGGGSIVEALVDDFELRGVRSAVDAVAESEGHIGDLGIRLSSNPIRTRADVSFRLPTAGRAAVCVYDCTGRLTRELFDGNAATGWHDITWDGRDSGGEKVAAGVYFLRVASHDRVKTKQIVLIR